jgi:hypothetical protein
MVTRPKIRPAGEKARDVKLRMSSEEIAAVDRHARRRRMTRTDYMVRSSLGEITEPNDFEGRMAALEAQMRELQRVFELGMVSGA